MTELSDGELILEDTVAAIAIGAITLAFILLILAPIVLYVLGVLVRILL